MAVVSEPTPLDILGGAVSAAAGAIAVALPGNPAPGEPIEAVADLPPGSVAVAGALAGAASGGIVIAVSPELAAAIQQNPLGAQELHAVLEPVIADALAALEPTFGSPLQLQAPMSIDAELALGSLRGAVVSVPLISGEDHVATFAVAVDMDGDEPASAPANGSFDLPDLDAPARRRSPIADPAALDLLGDVEMGVTAELGRTRMTVRDLLNLSPGAVVELDRVAGSPVDLLVNGTLIARGEVVVVDDEFGVRISEIISRNGERRGR